jgi:hypothetical protein
LADLTILCSEGTVLANEQFNINDVVIYPNPSNGIYNISSTISLDKLEVHDVTGKLLEVKTNLQINSNTAQLDLTQASTGIYFVKIYANEKSIVKRITKK